MSRKPNKNRNRQISKRMKKISEKVMAAAVTSSMMFSPLAGVNAFATDLNFDSTASIQALNDAVSILEAKGDLENVSVEWKGVNSATGYNVYYKSANSSDSNYKQLDTNLIRQYPSYFRADMPGLAAGNYVMKVVPIINNAEDSSKSSVTSIISVKSNVREGFAFSKNSTMGTGSGGYNDNGTVPSDATILYVTADNINTITADVVTSTKGKKTRCTGLADILAKRQKGIDKSHMIIRLVGEIKGSDINGLNSNGYLQIKGCYNLTLEGIGEDATVNGWGILIRDSKNIEVRNLGVMLFPDDGISLDTNNENIWIHNNDIFYGTAGSDKDQAKGDGSCDVKGYSNNVTISYNHFWDSGKCSLCGMSDSQEFFVTYHHNWFDHSDSRHPRIRVGSIHIYNNYFDGNAKYGVGVTKGSSAFVEANVFRNCKYPMMSSLQGTDVANGNQPTFSGEAGGMIKAYNNSITGAKNIIYAQNNSKSFDAYLVSSRNEAVPSSYKTVSGGTTYNNFDTSSNMYSYNPDSPSNVVNNVTAYAGRIDGGDFKWNFKSSDDTSYSINNELMNKIKEYKSSIVSIGGNSVVNNNQGGNTEDSEDSGDKDQGQTGGNTGNNNSGQTSDNNENESGSSDVSQSKSISVDFKTVVNGSSVSQNYTITNNEGTIDLNKVKIVYKAKNFPDVKQNLYLDSVAMVLNIAPWYKSITSEAKAELLYNGVAISLGGDDKLTAGTGKVDISLRIAKADWSPYLDFVYEMVEVYYDGELVK